MQNCKSLFHHIVIAYKTFTVALKTKNLPRITGFCLWSFYKGVLQDDQLSKTTTFAWSLEWMSCTDLTVL